MIAVGGLTRLTRSGLSITEWKVVSGVLPPLTEKHWQAEFEKYQKSPEYEKVNSHFTLSDYKNIFFWEWFHRNLGRFLFFVALIGGIILWWQELIPTLDAISIPLLIITQGAIGWIMVLSGLRDSPYVSPFKLTLHFFAALALLLFTHYRAFYRHKSWRWPRQSPALLALMITLVLQLAFGCLTAGWKAGFMHNDFPLMAGKFFPLWQSDLSPSFLNLIYNPLVVQWIHRWLGISVGLIAIWTVLEHWTTLRMQSIGLLVFVSLQVILGILTLMWSVPIHLGVLHQVNASLLVLIVFEMLSKKATTA